MQKVWIISDTHHFHENIKKFESRPEDFNEKIIKNWCNLVNENDIVFHLGDVIFSRPGELGWILDKLPGKKILTLGNHDRNNAMWFMNKGFDFACEQFVWSHEGVGDILFSHKPVTPLHNNDIVYNIHGHFHRNKVRKDYEHNKYYHAHLHRYKLLQIEDTLAPIELDKFLSAHEK